MKRLSLFSFLLFSFILSSCGGDSSTGPVASGDIWGYVTLADQDGIQLNDHSGMQVSLEGTTHSTTSDVNGKWVLTDVPAGVYNVMFQKQGFSWRKEQLQYVGNGAYYMADRRFAQLPSFQVVDFTAVVKSSSEIAITVQMSETPPENIIRYCYVFMSTDATSFEKISSMSVYGVSGQAASIEGMILVSDLYRRGITPGTVLYLKAYPASEWSQSYFNPQTRETTLTHIAETGSPVVQIVVP